MVSSALGAIVSLSPLKKRRQGLDAPRSTSKSPKRTSTSASSSVSQEHGIDLDGSFDDLLTKQNVPESLRQGLKNVTKSVKHELLTNASLSERQHDLPCTPKKAKAASNASPSFKRPAAGLFSPHGSKRSKAAPGSNVHIDSVQACLSFSTPEQTIDELSAKGRSWAHQIGVLKRTRLLLRNEKIEWTEEFSRLGGFEAINKIFESLLEIEWPEEEEELAFKELLLCLNAISTSKVGLAFLEKIECSIFPRLLKVLFSTKQPSEMKTRSSIVRLLDSYLVSSADQAKTARSLLQFLEDAPDPKDTEQLGFITATHKRRPYRDWNKELANVVRDVFWIFMHGFNTLHSQPSTIASRDTDESADQTAQTGCRQDENILADAPQADLPIGYLRGVEWEAILYLDAHLQLLVHILQSLPSSQERNSVRADMKICGFEKILGERLRKCSTKHYKHMHQVMAKWVQLAQNDGWSTTNVQFGFQVAPALQVPKLAPINLDDEEIGRVV